MSNPTNILVEALEAIRDDASVTIRIARFTRDALTRYRALAAAPGTEGVVETTGPTTTLYRKRPVIVEAMQLLPGKAKLPPGVEVYWDTVSPKRNHYYRVWTASGWTEVEPGSWVVTAPSGDRWPVRADIFEATYDPIAPRTPDAAGTGGATGALGEALRREKYHHERADRLAARLDEAHAAIRYLNQDGIANAAREQFVYEFELRDADLARVPPASPVAAPPREPEAGDVWWHNTERHECTLDRYDGRMPTGWWLKGGGYYFDDRFTDGTLTFVRHAPPPESTSAPGESEGVEIRHCSVCLGYDQRRRVENKDIAPCVRCGVPTRYTQPTIYKVREEGAADAETMSRAPAGPTGATPPLPHRDSPTPEPATPGSGEPCGAMFRWIPCCDPHRRTHADACDLPLGHKQMAHGKAHSHAAAPPPTQGPGEGVRWEHSLVLKAIAQARAEALREVLAFVVESRRKRDNRERGLWGGGILKGLSIVECWLRYDQLGEERLSLSSEPPVPGETPEPDSEAPRG